MNLTPLQSTQTKLQLARLLDSKHNVTLAVKPNPNDAAMCVLDWRSDIVALSDVDKSRSIAEKVRACARGGAMMMWFMLMCAVVLGFGWSHPCL